MYHFHIDLVVVVHRNIVCVAAYLADVVVIVVVIVVVVIVIVVADHIDDSLYSNQDEGGKAKRGELGAWGTQWLALLRPVI